jgi:hypothetical protein
MDTRTPNGIPWLMVPYDLAADIILRHSRRYTIHKAHPTTLTVQPLGYRSYRVFGNRVTWGQPTYLSAVDSSGVHQAFLEVSVKPVSVWKVAFYFVHDSNLKTGRVIHSARQRSLRSLEDLVQRVNDILRPQSNVLFKIEQSHNITLEGDFGKKVREDIFLSLVDNLTPAAMFHVFFVWEYEPAATRDAHASTITVDEGGVCVFEDLVPYQSEAWVLAHEAVHFLLSFHAFTGDHHTSSIADLMYPRTGAWEFAAGNRLGRKYADIINPWDTVRPSSP